MNEPESLRPLKNNLVRWRGRNLVYFSGCDYFRLSQDATVLRAAASGLKQYGLNAAASRLTTGQREVYEILERRLARFFGAPSALLLPGGYMTGMVLAQALAGTFSHALLDERAHPALLDAAELLGCPVLKFRHRDEEAFARAITRVGRGARPLVLTDGMFSHDGSVAPLKDYLKLLPRDGLLVVDDAHGAGVLGRNGRGTPEHEGVDRRRLVQCVTLSKAFGVYGGAILGARDLRARIFERSRAFIGSTPLSPALAGAAIKALDILSVRGKRLRRRMNENTGYVRAALRGAGWPISDTPGPIVSLSAESPAESAALRRRLLAAGIYPPFLRYPGGNSDGCFRFVISSEHSRAQLDQLVGTLVF